MRSLWEGMCEELHLITRDHLDNESGSDGERWEGLLDATIKRKVADSKHSKILHQDLFLRDSFSYKASGAGVEFGSNRLYAATTDTAMTAADILVAPHAGRGLKLPAAQIGR